MANKSLFRSLMGKMLPKTDTVNHEGTPAYALPPKHALAQLAATGCMNRTFYASAEEQRDRVLALCETIEPAFIARAAVFCRERGFMKDMPALLCAVLSIKDRALFEKVFSRVVDNGKMLRTFVQIVRSGAVGRKSLGSLPKRMIRRWLAARSDEEIVKASVGQDPSLGDILRMVHPKPEPGTREALYGWLLGRAPADKALPDIVQRFEAFKAGRSKDVPNVPFQMLTALPLGTREWTDIARHAPWQATRMNLNTFARHRVFETPGMDRLVAERLRDKAALARSRVFPYQLMAAYASAAREVPAVVRDALQDAMQAAIANVPAIEGNVFVFPDVSGSMRSAITGARKGATSAIRCVDVAALVSAANLRKNPPA
ncbi:MAG: RNA-binding protein, partial [Planctomycetota bacterium]